MRQSPFRAHPRIVWPALLMFFLQAFQIDIETWRRVSMMIGMVWDMEAARLCWDGARARSLKPAPDGGIPEAWSGWR